MGLLWLLMQLVVGTVAVPPGVAVLSHADLVAGGATLEEALKLAFVGDASYSLVIVRDIPGFAAARRAAMNATVRLARSDQLLGQQQLGTFLSIE